MKRTAKHATGSVVVDKRRGTWNFYWYDAKGQRRSKLIGTKQQYPNRASAWAAVTSCKPTVKDQQEGHTMAMLVDRYETDRMPMRHSTRRVYRSFLRRHIVPRWGTTPICEMQPREVELWLRSLELAPKTRSHLRNLLHVLLEFAMWAGMLPVQRNQMELVVVKGATKRVKKPRSLTVEQFQVLLATLHEPFATLALLSVCLGLRISEALAVRWSDVDWLNSTLSIRRAIVERHVDVPKTENSAETMKLSPDLLSRLQLWRRSTQFAGEHDWLFGSPMKIGRLPYSYTGVWRELQRAAGVAGIGRLGTHSFRHTYRSWLDQVGTPMAVQQKAMRHSDIRTTMNVYGDVVDGRIGEALQKVSGLAFSASSTQAARGDA